MFYVAQKQTIGLVRAKLTSMEIAKLAGVSRSTVSRVLNGYSNVPQETYEKVMNIVEKYEFVPNSSARVLAGKETNVIGLFIMSRAESKLYNNDFTGQFLNALVEAATNHGYFVLLNVLERENAKEGFFRMKQSFYEKRIDAAVIVDANEASVTHLDDMIQKRFPLCLVDIDKNKLCKEAENGNTVIINAANYVGACDIMRYLMRLGHRKIGFIKGEMNTYSATERYRAYWDIMKENGCAIRPQYVLEGEFSAPQTILAVEKMLSECGSDLPTALFCANDAMALAAINVLKENGYRVPEDVSVVGFDNLKTSQYSVPALTTVENPIFDIAEKAMECLLRMKQKEQTQSQSYEMPVKMILRDSCMSLK